MWLPPVINVHLFFAEIRNTIIEWEAVALRTWRATRRGDANNGQYVGRTSKQSPAALSPSGALPRQEILKAMSSSPHTCRRYSLVP